MWQIGAKVKRDETQKPRPEIGHCFRTHLFNPRRQRWSAHFCVDGGEVVLLEVTMRLLAINNEARVEIRATLAQLELYPRR